MKKTFLVFIKRSEIKKYFIPILVLSCIVFLILFYIFYNPTNIKETTTKKAYVALIFDDAGMDIEEAAKFLKLNIPFDVAVIPFLPFSNKIALMCKETNKEVMIHFSMEPENGDSTWLGPRTIFNNTSDEEIERIFTDALSNIPYAKGFNNHMGSLVCSNERIVKKLVSLAKQYNFFIVDSKTTPKSQFEKFCKIQGVDFADRDLFLETKNEVAVIKSQLRKLVTIAKKKGYAVGIGHFGAEGGITTLTAISEMIDEMKKNDIEFVYVSGIINIINKSED